MSASDKVVSSRISRFAAASGLGSAASIEPEQTAHLPLVSGDNQPSFKFAATSWAGTHLSGGEQSNV
jgi:hypothetical protein